MRMRISPEVLARKMNTVSRKAKRAILSLRTFVLKLITVLCLNLLNYSIIICIFYRLKEAIDKIQ